MRSSVVRVAVGIAVLFAVPIARAEAGSPPPSAPAVAGGSSHGEHCGAKDLPETGLQGDIPRTDQADGRALEGYNCGVDVVGWTDLGGRGGNANMAWSGSCAYVAGIGNGIAVVDVSNPRAPRQVGTLHGAGSDLTIETIAAYTGPGRAILAAGRYGLLPLPIGAPVDFYDVSDCTRPKLITTFTYPSNVHNLTFSPDGKRLYSTLPLQVLDLTDVAHPKYLGNLDTQIAQAAALSELIPQAKYLAHEVETSPDGKLLYLGGQTPEYPTFTIVDISGWPAHPPKLLSQVSGRGHDIRLATIGGRTYALHSEESIVNPTAKGCVSETLNPVGGASQPWLSDVTDPAHPKMRLSQFTLAINDPANCATEIADNINASVHYHDVDDPAHTTFALLSMWNAGLRIVDIRNPLKPREVAYFNPAEFKAVTGTTLDQAWAHIRYMPSTGQIWFTTEKGGFWVLELEPQVRSQLGLSAVPSAHPLGAPARPADSLLAVVKDQPNTYVYYCTLGAVAAPLTGG